MTEREEIDEIKYQLQNLDWRFLELKKEWELYETAYKKYISKKYRIRDWLFGIYYRVRTGKHPDVRRKTRRRMARVFSD